MAAVTELVAVGLLAGRKANWPACGSRVSITLVSVELPVAPATGIDLAETLRLLLPELTMLAALVVQL